jgi:hypothetical protein
MEFASEMVIKASLMELRISEVPTSLRCDHPCRRPHLRTWRDGWRHLRFMLSFSPKYSLLPLAMLALLLALACVISYGMQIPPFSGPNTLIVASFALMASLVLVSDYVSNSLLISQFYAARRRARVDLLMACFTSYRGTNRLFQLCVLFLLASLLCLTPLGFGMSASSRASNLLLFSAASLATGSFVAYLTATKLATVLALQPQEPC